MTLINLTEKKVKRFYFIKKVSSDVMKIENFKNRLNYSLYSIKSVINNKYLSVENGILKTAKDLVHTNAIFQFICKTHN
jgi:hypothetical protein